MKTTSNFVVVLMLLATGRIAVVEFRAEARYRAVIKEKIAQYTAMDDSRYGGNAMRAAREHARFYEIGLHFDERMGHGNPG